jgi:nicotinamidase-related amidase
MRKYHSNQGKDMKALLLIDLQNDYFPGGKFPLWNTEAVLQKVLSAVEKAKQQGILLVHVQHIANSKMGIAPFFNEGTSGADIHPRVLAAAPEASIVVKEFADSFEQTSLEQTLTAHGVTDLLVCGMMTQNCVTHTAISKAAEKYHVTILVDCCTTVDEMIHNIALHAVSTRVRLEASGSALTSISVNG